MKTAITNQSRSHSIFRYYIQHFVDTFRQCCLDLLLGNQINEHELDQELEFLTTIKTIGNIACNAIVPDDMPVSKVVPVYFNQVARDEIFLLDITYSLSRSVSLGHWL